MRVRRIAILIDGAFFLKRLPKLVEPRFCDTPAATADSARHLCKRHVQRLTNLEGGSADGVWLDHVYRLFYYDAHPFQGVSHHPVLNYRVEFAKSEVAAFRSELFAELRRKRKFALRLGHTHKEGVFEHSIPLIWRGREATSRGCSSREVAATVAAQTQVPESGEAISSSWSFT